MLLGTFLKVGSCQPACMGCVMAAFSSICCVRWLHIVNVQAAGTCWSTLQMLYMCEYCVVPCYLSPLAGLLCDRLSLYFQLVCLKMCCVL